MIDCFVFQSMNPGFNHRLGVCRPLIRHHHFNRIAHVLFDVLRERSALYIVGMEEAKLSSALFNADYDLFVGLCFVARSHAFFAADIGFIDLYDAVQRCWVDFLHRSADTMAQIPRRLVRDAQRALELVRAHAFLGLAQQVDTEKPLPQWQVRIVEDRSGSHRELVAASIAVKLIALYDLRNLVRIAARASNLIRPAQSLKVSSASIFAVELLNQSAKVNGVHYA